MPKYYGRGRFSGKSAGTGYRVQRFGGTAAAAGRYQAGVAARRAASRAISGALADPMLQNVVMRGAPLMGEIKYRDTTAVGSPHAGGNFNCIVQMQKGADVNQRVGREITVKGIQLRYVIRPPVLAMGGSTANIPLNLVRCFIVVDRQANASTPSLADLFTDAGGGSCVTSNYNAINKKRYYFLYDKVISVPCNGTLVGMNAAASPRVVSKFVNIVVEYGAGDAGSSADITTNSVWFGYVGDHTGLGGGADHTIQWSCRVNYLD